MGITLLKLMSQFTAKRGKIFEFFLVNLLVRLILGVGVETLTLMLNLYKLSKNSFLFKFCRKHFKEELGGLLKNELSPGAAPSFGENISFLKKNFKTKKR
jgi:hypothetical protein